MVAVAPNQQTQLTEPYVEKFERLEKKLKQPAWLFPIRKAGIARFAELGFPTLQHEDWRFTNIAPITRLAFKPVLEYGRDGLSAQSLKQFTFAGLDAVRLVFVNGHFSPELSSGELADRTIKVGNLAAALSADSSVIEQRLVRHAAGHDNAFTALNTAFFQDGAFVHVPAGKVVERPIHVLCVSTASQPGATAHPRNLIIAESGSQVTVIESYATAAEGRHFTNAVTELAVGDGAVVEHLKFQDESEQAFHVAALQLDLGRSLNFISHSIALGAKLSRNTIRATLGGEGIEAVLNGLYLTKDDQLADHHMIVEHARPHCASHEYYNGILDDRSKGVFHGRILVRPDAQKTDAKQTNKNLLLSDEATVDTKPQLEIYADDVKCTHGATVGQLDENSIFYLRARGIPLETARRMLIHAFAGEIIARVRHQPAREELDKLVWDRLEANPHLAESK